MLQEALKEVDAKIEFLEKEVKRCYEAKHVAELNERNMRLVFNKMIAHTSVKQIYHHKKRHNTTIVFNDGTQVTVKLKHGEKNCIETAIAYCLLKHWFTKAQLKKLMAEMEVIDE